MELVKTTELVVGQHAALMMDLPNCGGIQVSAAGTVERIELTDIWGVDSETHCTIWLNVARPLSAKDVKVFTVNNSHNWLVRTRQV